MTGLMGLLLAGQSAQAANKISSVRVGFLQKEYRTANPERQAQILEQLNTGGYPAIATQLQKGAPAKPALTKEKPVAEQIREIKKEQQELPAVKQEVNKELADAAKAERALAEQQAKEREEEAKKIKALEAEKQRLEQQGKEEEAAKKIEELAAAREKQLQDELRREEEIKNAAAERQRLENEQKALNEQAEKLRKEALAKEASEKDLAAILTAGETKLKEFKTQLANAKTVQDSEMVIAGVNTFWRTIQKMSGFSANQNDQAVQNLNAELRKVQTTAEAKRDEIQKAAGKGKEEVKEEKTIPPAPTPKPGEAGKKPIGLKEEIEEKAKKQRLEAIEKMESAKMKAAAEQKVNTFVQGTSIAANEQIAALNAEIKKLNALFEKGRAQRLALSGNKGPDGITYDNHDEMVRAQTILLSDFGSNEQTNKENYQYYLALHKKLKELRKSNPAGMFTWDATELEFKK
jgi:hypothetical protein